MGVRNMKGIVSAPYKPFVQFQFGGPPSRLCYAGPLMRCRSAPQHVRRARCLF